MEVRGHLQVLVLALLLCLSQGLYLFLTEDPTGVLRLETHGTIYGFTWILETRADVLMLRQQALYQLGFPRAGRGPPRGGVVGWGGGRGGGKALGGRGGDLAGWRGGGVCVCVGVWVCV